MKEKMSSNSMVKPSTASAARVTLLFSAEEPFSGKEAEEMMFVDFTVSVPPPAQEAPPEEPKPEEKAPEPEPEPPPEPEPVIPEPIPEPKKPEPEPKKEEAKKPPEKPKPKVIRQTNMVTRTFAANAPVAKDKPLSEAEIAKLLKA